MSTFVQPTVIYAGLVGCAIALLVATAQNKWSPRVFLILALRLAIGWHFMFEGLHKIHSHMVGPTDSNKVFTSEPYFALADGPLGPIVRQRIGDPATLINQRVVAAREVDKAKNIDEKNAKAWVEFVPDAIAKEWSDYVKKFESVYLKGQPVEVSLPNSILANYGKWLTGIEPGKESKIRYVQTDIPYTVPQRLKHLERVEKQLSELMDRQKAGFGQGYGYDQSRITAAKQELRNIRTDLLSDADSLLADMKKELFVRSSGDRLMKFELPGVQLKNDAKIANLLAFSLPNDQSSYDSVVPPAVKEIWTNYLEVVQSTFPLKDQAVADATAYPKQVLADWFRKNWVKLVEATKVSDKDSAGKAKETILAELDKQFNQYRNSILAAIPANVADGVVAEKKAKPIEELDKFTMWFIAGVGACIFFGFLTPVACLAAFGFLVMTYLTHPPFPWLPLPPNTEGNPLFINKNVIEGIALLVIAAHPTGRWMGFDALWTFFVGIGKGR